MNLVLKTTCKFLLARCNSGKNVLHKLNGKKSYPVKIGSLVLLLIKIATVSFVTTSTLKAHKL